MSGANASEPSKAITVLVADDDPILREALTELLADVASLRLVGSARDADEAIALAENARPDVAMVDLRMPGGGAHATREIVKRSPGTRVLILSARADDGTVSSLLGAGATGYLAKGSPPCEIISAIHGAASTAPASAPDRHSAWTIPSRSAMATASSLE